MDDVMEQEVSGNKEQTDEEVMAYLRQNPDFFARNPDILDHLEVPSRMEGQAGSVVDFQQALVERLRSDNRAALESQRELIENSRANMNIQGRIHAAILSMLEARDFDEFAQTVTTDLSVILNLDVVSVIVETDNEDDSLFLRRCGFRVVPTDVCEFALDNLDAVLHSDIAGEKILYGPGAGLVRSQALLRLEVSDDLPVGILAFGSRDPEFFQEGQGTELIGYLARVVERCIRTWWLYRTE